MRLCEKEWVQNSVYGADYLRVKKSKKELAAINKELKELRVRGAELENRKRELSEPMGEMFYELLTHK